ncbi:MAG TPA: hypothetical protein VN893_14910 [Bryobacteraceae bacterium]|nr:hypothetical protein [Bryobacteraceae bacterium]
MADRVADTTPSLERIVKPRRAIFLFPSLPFEVRVPRAQLEEARRAIASAEEAGPDAADEAELESEEGGQ